MKEVITIHIGEAGVQMGNACWELFCLEHEINPSGEMSYQDYEDDSFQTFFSETSKGKYDARSLFIDLEPTVVDEVRTGSYRQLFHPDNLISGKESAASNFNRGHYSIGRGIVDLCLEKIRKSVESCEGFQGFIFTHSIGGGTGSGFGTLLLERLSKEYGKKSKHAFTIYPSPKLSTSVVEPYNAVLSTYYLLEYSDLVTVLGNESLYKICSQHLDVESPSYSNINRLIAQTMSSYTCSMRFDGSLNYDLNDIQSNMVPYPRIHFLHSSYAPLTKMSQAYHEQPSIYQITKSAFDPSLMMIDVNTKERMYMACCMMYRGDAPLLEVNHAISEVKKRKNVKFMDWTPSAFKVGITYQPSAVVPCGDFSKSMRSLFMLGNSTAIADVFERIRTKYDLLYDKGAFLHWFVLEGGDSDQMAEAREDLVALERDYWPKDGVGIATYDDGDY